MALVNRKADCEQVLLRYNTVLGRNKAVWRSLLPRAIYHFRGLLPRKLAAKVEKPITAVFGPELELDALINHLLKSGDLGLLQRLYNELGLEFHSGLEASEQQASTDETEALKRNYTQPTLSSKDTVSELAQYQQRYEKPQPIIDDKKVRTKKFRELIHDGLLGERKKKYDPARLLSIEELLGVDLLERQQDQTNRGDADSEATRERAVQISMDTKAAADLVHHSFSRVANTNAQRTIPPQGATPERISWVLRNILNELMLKAQEDALAAAYDEETRTYNVRRYNRELADSTAQMRQLKKLSAAFFRSQRHSIGQETWILNLQKKRVLDTGLHAVRRARAHYNPVAEQDKNTSLQNINLNAPYLVVNASELATAAEKNLVFALQRRMQAKTVTERRQALEKVDAVNMEELLAHNRRSLRKVLEPLNKIEEWSLRLHRMRYALGNPLADSDGNRSQRLSPAAFAQYIYQDRDIDTHFYPEDHAILKFLRAQQQNLDAFNELQHLNQQAQNDAYQQLAISLAKMSAEEISLFLLCVDRAQHEVLKALHQRIKARQFHDALKLIELEKLEAYQDDRGFTRVWKAILFYCISMPLSIFVALGEAIIGAKGTLGALLLLLGIATLGAVAPPVAIVLVGTVVFFGFCTLLANAVLFSSSNSETMKNWFSELRSLPPIFKDNEGNRLSNSRLAFLLFSAVSCTAFGIAYGAIMFSAAITLIPIPFLGFAFGLFFGTIIGISLGILALRVIKGQLLTEKSWIRAFASVLTPKAFLNEFDDSKNKWACFARWSPNLFMSWGIGIGACLGLTLIMFVAMAAIAPLPIALATAVISMAATSILVMATAVNFFSPLLDKGWIGLFHAPKDWIKTFKLSDIENVRAQQIALATTVSIIMLGAGATLVGVGIYGALTLLPFFAIATPFALPIAITVAIVFTMIAAPMLLRRGIHLADSFFVRMYGHSEEGQQPNHGQSVAAVSITLGLWGGGGATVGVVVFLVLSAIPGLNIALPVNMGIALFCAGFTYFATSGFIPIVTQKVRSFMQAIKPTLQFLGSLRKSERQAAANNVAVTNIELTELNTRNRSLSVDSDLNNNLSEATLTNSEVDSLSIRSSSDSSISTDSATSSQESTDSALSAEEQQQANTVPVKTLLKQGLLQILPNNPARNAHKISHHSQKVLVTFAALVNTAVQGGVSGSGAEEFSQHVLPKIPGHELITGQHGIFHNHTVAHTADMVLDVTAAISWACGSSGFNLPDALGLGEILGSHVKEGNITLQQVLEALNNAIAIPNKISDDVLERILQGLAEKGLLNPAALQYHTKIDAQGCANIQVSVSAKSA